MALTSESKLLASKKWRAKNKKKFANMNADWYRRNGKRRYRDNRERHKENSGRAYAKSIGLTRSEIMARIKSVSGLEVSARSFVTMLAGCRLRHQPRGIVGNPDYANKARKVAVFVDGCWWHVCPRHFKMPKTNVKFWRKKFSDNVARRKRFLRALKREGWTVLTVWEHEIKARKAARSARPRAR